MRALAAIPSHQPSSRTYQVMIAVIYYAGLRPSETIMLRPRAPQLPDEGWGRIDVAEADISFDQPGEPKPVAAPSRSRRRSSPCCESGSTSTASPRTS